MLVALMPFLKGLGLGGSLIIAIGAQNAFVLTQGLRRNHHYLVAALCSLVDIVLILAGVAGMGLLIADNPLLLQAATWGGAAFLLWFGATALRSAMKPGTLQEDQNAEGYSRGKIILTTLAVSLLNPHVYLDTVVMLGSIGGRYAPDARVWFAVGAVTASFLWFFSLSLGAQWLAPLFRKPIAWRVLDGLVCLIVWAIAASLIVQGLSL